LDQVPHKLEVLVDLQLKELALDQVSHKLEELVDQLLKESVKV
jgi:hypothetical protein